MSYINKISLFTFAHINRNRYAKYVHTVHHNVKRSTFYVKLDDNSKAVLQYVADRKVLDMQTINVPYRYSGQGLARLLTETACKYVILNYYFMYLSCEYMQKYYLTYKYPALEDCVVGPPHILEGPAPEPVDSIFIYDMPDPEDFLIYTT